MKLVPSLNLRHGQRHRCTATDAMEGDLLDRGLDVMEAGVDEGPRALTVIVATFAASWRFSNCTIRAGDHRNKEDIKTKPVGIKIKVLLESILPATMASDLASHAREALAPSSTV